jgi:hypothetical protein
MKESGVFQQSRSTNTSIAKSNYIKTELKLIPKFINKFNYKNENLKQNFFIFGKKQLKEIPQTN